MVPYPGSKQKEKDMGSSFKRFAAVAFALAFLGLALRERPFSSNASSLPPPAAGPALSTAPEATARLIDSARGKTLTVRVFYPRDGGPYPLIVFSHGYGGTPAAYQSFLTAWAAHGYVIVAPEHADAGAIGRGGFRTQMRTMLQVIADPDALAARVSDVKLCIDNIPMIERQVPDLAGRIDRTAIAVGGHSFGAETAMGIAGASYDNNPGGNYRDPRVKAALAMSPEGAGVMGLNQNSWSTIAIPMMIMTGSRDIEPGRSAQVRLDAYRLSPPGDKFACFIDGATHFSFTDLPLMRARPQTEAIHDAIEDTSLAYWNATLRSSASARDWLTSSKSPKEPGVDAQWMAR